MSSNTGWVCPICGKVNAPWVPTCSCNGNVPWTYNPGPTCSDAPEKIECNHKWVIDSWTHSGNENCIHATCAYCGEELMTSNGDISKWPK